jgi:hypothetical protein
MALRDSSSSSALITSVLILLGEVKGSDFTAATRRRFRAGGLTTSSMSRMSALVSSALVAKANRANEARVIRLGGDVGSDTRSKSFAVSLETLDVRIFND